MPELDFASIAKRHGGTVEPPAAAPASFDFGAIAKKHGGTVEAAALVPTPRPAPMKAEGFTDPASVKVTKDPGHLTAGHPLVDRFREAKASIKHVWETLGTPLLPESFGKDSVAAFEAAERRAEQEDLADKVTTPLERSDAAIRGFSTGVQEGVSTVVRGLTSPLNIGLTALGIGEGVILKRIGDLTASLPKIAEAIQGAKELKATGQLTELAKEYVSSVERLRDLERLRLATRSAQAATGAAFTVEGAANLVNAPTFTEKALAVAQVAGGAAMALTGTAGAREALRDARESAGFVAGAREASGRQAAAPAPPPGDVVAPPPAALITDGVEPPIVRTRTAPVPQAPPRAPPDIATRRARVNELREARGAAPVDFSAIAKQHGGVVEQVPATPAPALDVVPSPTTVPPAVESPESPARFRTEQVGDVEVDIPINQPPIEPEVVNAGTPVVSPSGPAAAPAHEVAPNAEAPSATFAQVAEKHGGVVEAPTLALRIGNDLQPVASLEEAGHLYDTLRRQYADQEGPGSSRAFPQAHVIDTNTGEPVARISDNGRLWDTTTGKEIERADGRGYEKEPPIAGEVVSRADSAATSIPASKAEDESSSLPQPATRYRADNPFAAKAASARARYERISGPTTHDRAMGNSFPLGGGYGRPGGEKRIERSVSRSVEAVRLHREAEYLLAQADAFEAGRINAQGRRINQASIARSDKRATYQEKRTARVEAAKIERGDKPMWEVRADVYADSTNNLGGPPRQLVLSDHREAVERAIQAGQFVPEEVLADYPDLRAVAPVSVDTLDTGEVQRRLPEAGAVREQQVATPQLDAPFSLSGEADTTTRERQTSLLDTTAPEAQTLEDVGRPEARAELRDGAREQPHADQERSPEGESDGGVPERRRLPSPLDYAGEGAFQRATPQADAARLTPEVRRELARIADELHEFPYEKNTWHWLGEGEAKTGNAAGGAADIVGGGAGAPVYDDVLQFSPLSKGRRGQAQAKMVRGTRAAVETAIRNVLSTGFIHNNLAEGAVRVAERRHAGDYRHLSRPQLPPVWGEEAPQEFVDRLSDAIDESLANVPDGDTSFDPDGFDQGGGGGGYSNVGMFSEAPATTAELPTQADRRLFPPPGAPITTGTIRPAEFPELVELAKRLQDIPDVVKAFRKVGKMGEFRPGGIRLAAELFKKGNEYQLAGALAHEIGHLVDWLPSQTLKRGNLIGRLLSLQSFLKHTFTAVDGSSVKNADIRKELQALSDAWRPWDPAKASASFATYRHSGVELYADAISVLLNNPGMLQAQAPTFFREFFAALDRKPDVERAYFDLQEILSGTREELIERRRTGVRKMLEEGDATALEIEQQRQAELAARNRDLMFRLKMQLVDKNYAVIDRVTALAKRGVRINEDDDPRYLLEERNYLGGKLKAFTERNFAPIYRALSDADIHWNAFGEALFYKRIIAGDRSEVANPRGLSPASAGELYESLKRELGPEKTAVVRAEITKFRAAVKSVSEDAWRAGLYTDELHTQMAENPAYVTFQVIEHLENALTSRVHKQIGTLKDIANPADSTILKTLVTIRAIERQKMLTGNIGFLREFYPSDIEDAKMVWGGKGHRPVESKDPKKHLVTYYDRGVLKGVYVDEYLAHSWNNETIGSNNAVVQIMRRLNSGLFRPLFVTFNPGFMGFNAVRDFQRFWKNMPTMTLGRALHRYWDAVPMSKIRAFGLSKAPTAKALQAQQDLLDAEESKILGITFNHLLAGREVEDSQIEDILTRMNVAGFHTPKRSRFAKPFMAIVDTIKAVGDFIETLPKAAALYEFKGSGSVSALPPNVRSFIRRKVGTPDAMAGGTWKPVTNELLLFSNIFTQGVLSDYEVATDPQTRAGFWWKTAKVNLLPKVLIWAALAGAFGETVRRFYERVTEYDKTNYLPIPLGTDEKGNSVYFRMPQEQTGQVIGGTFWKMLQLLRGNRDAGTQIGQIIDYTAGQMPSLAPAFTAMQGGLQMAGGQNPRDVFRGRNVLTDDEQKAGGLRAWKKFFGWEFQQLGGGTVWKFFPGEERPIEKTTGQKILDLPVLSNIIGRFIRITNYGDVEDLRGAQSQVQREEARRRLDERDAVNAAIRQYQGLDEANQRSPQRIAGLAMEVTKNLYGDDLQEAKRRFPQVQARLRTGLLRGDADPFLSTFLSATSNAQKLAILEAWMKKQPTPPLVPAGAR